MDILAVIHRNYDVTDLFIDHWQQWMAGDWRLLLCDNTPRMQRRKNRWRPSDKIIYYELDIGGIDGETHGGALDFLVERAESPIIGITDTDFFWLNPDIIKGVEYFFNNHDGYTVGAAGWYDDWLIHHDPTFLLRQGHMAPMIWGVFAKTEYAKEQTFIVNAVEAKQKYETSWRFRERIIKEDKNRLVFQGFRYPNQPDRDVCFFGEPEKPQGMHVLKGSFAGKRPINYEHIKTMLEEGRSKWKAGEPGNVPSMLAQGNARNMKPKEPTITVIIPSISGPRLDRTLASISKQRCLDGDQYLIVGDGPQNQAEWVVHQHIQNTTNGHLFKYIEGPPTKQWGNAQRNFAMEHYATGDVISWMDEDDVYLDGAFDAIRKHVMLNPGKVRLFRFYTPGNTKIWDNYDIAIGWIGGHCIVADNNPERLGRWSSEYTGDYDFIVSTIYSYPGKLKDVVWIDHFIADARPELKGRG